MAMESLPIMDELDSEPTLEDINQALDHLSSGKAPGNDGIPVEVIKCAKGTLLKELHEILSCRCHLILELHVIIYYHSFQTL